MNPATEREQLLKDVANVLLWCFTLTMVLLFVWLFFIVFAWDLTYRVHTAFLDITKPHFDLVHYAGLTLTKGTAFILFLCPYVAIRIVLRTQSP